MFFEDGQRKEREGECLRVEQLAREDLGVPLLERHPFQFDHLVPFGFWLSCDGTAEGHEHAKLALKGRGFYVWFWRETDDRFWGGPGFLFQFFPYQFFATLVSLRVATRNFINQSFRCVSVLIGVQDLSIMCYWKHNDWIRMSYEPT